MTFNLITGVSSDDYAKLTDLLKRAGRGVTEATPFIKGVCSALVPGLVLFRGAIEIAETASVEDVNGEVIASLDQAVPSTAPSLAASSFSDVPGTIPNVVGD